MSTKEHVVKRTVRRAVRHALLYGQVFYHGRCYDEGSLTQLVPVDFLHKAREQLRGPVAPIGLQGLNWALEIERVSSAQKNNNRLNIIGLTSAEAVGRMLSD